MEAAVVGQLVAPIRALLLRHNAVKIPDELFFSTLAHNPHLGLPGSCVVAPPPSNEVGLGFLGRFVIWKANGIPCSTKFVRKICIFGTAHVPLLQRVPHLLANKFHSDYFPEAYEEMEKWYFMKLAREIRVRTYDTDSFDPSVYANRTCSQHHL